MQLLTDSTLPLIEPEDCPTCRSLPGFAAMLDAVTTRGPLSNLQSSICLVDLFALRRSFRRANGQNPAAALDGRP
ncbi:uncharacterized protein N7479_006151 [Penicillium vulpinum]|uniref:uncharacterized protein n=1 Tax=Penicillium vulpinum TaxID=29845 RepID=UPI0025491659|nr:uncharacterized protein N7479_006151 [Penicillium vulpinum]KAJ5959001.1 hypothetical protein N7479_006151 [Penicillium vulpinum]